MKFNIKFLTKGDEKMKKVSIFVIVMIIVFVPFFMFAENPNEPDDEMGPGMAISGIFRFINELNLTAEQEQKLQTMRDSSKRELFSMRNELKTAVWDIQDEFKKDTVDKNKINALTDKMADIEKQIIKIRTEHMFKLKEILTPEQFKKLIMLLEKHKASMGKKFFRKLDEQKK
jgi:Spy/CpxP family protein refolding chaperone